MLYMISSPYRQHRYISCLFLVFSLIFLYISIGAAQSVVSASQDASIPESSQSPVASGDSGDATPTSISTVASSITTSTTSITTTSSSISTSSISTCPSRTVNYITHTLAQQCARTDRIAATGTSLQPTETPALPTPSASPEELDADSALDNANFLSFEEWKKQNLARLGQVADTAGKTRPDKQQIENALESLGEGNDFDMGISFGDQSQSATAAKDKASTGDKTAVSADKAAPSGRARKKDAGTTCKERSNYASTDCAAAILKTNPKCKSSSAILKENKDSYMLNECSTDNKFLIVELCDDILVDTVVLANFEFFSSMFRTFRVSVSERYPVKMDRWKELGTFEARNAREIQAFAIDNPLIWTRYLRIEFLSHFGAEFYCPVSLLRVHGTTMLEEMRNPDDSNRGDDDVEDDVPVSSAIEPIAPPVVVEERKPETPVQKAVKDSPPSEPDTQTSPDIQAARDSRETISPTTSVVAANMSSISQESSGSSIPIPSPAIGPSQKENTPETKKPSSTIALSNTSKTSAASSPISKSETTPATQGQQSKQVPESADPVIVPPPQSSSSTSIKSSAPSSVSSPSSGASPIPRSPSVVKEPNRPSIPGVQPPAPSPTTQESFFKSFQKRLQVLEVNATLSLQYIEEQSRILRDAFTKVEKRQMGKLDEFIRHLNTTVMSELKGFRQQYDQLWQSTVIELDTNRDQHQKEVAAFSTRLTLLADELVWQKRMAVVQSTLLILCLGLIIFVRSGGSHLELPIMQHVLNKSHSVLGFPFDSPRAMSSSKENSPRRETRRLIRVRSVDDLEDSDDDSRLMNSPSPSPPGLKRMIDDDTSFNNTPTKDMDMDDTPITTPADTPLERTPSITPRVRDLLRPSRSGPTTPRGTRDDKDPMRWVDRTLESSPLSRSNSIYEADSMQGESENGIMNGMSDAASSRLVATSMDDDTQSSDSEALHSKIASLDPPNHVKL